MTTGEPGIRDATASLSLLARQRDLYRSLKALAQRQRALITAGRQEELLGVLAERQKVVEQLTALNDEVKTLRERWGRVYWSLNASERNRADAMVQEVQQTLAEILAADEHDARLLSARIAGGRRESLEAAESQRLHRAYVASTATPTPAGGCLDGVDDQL